MWDRGSTTGPRSPPGWTARRGAPDRTWTLLGQSIPFVALDWALEHPARVERLVLCAPPFQLGFRPSFLKVKVAQAIARFWPGFSQGNMILPSMLSHDQKVIRAHMEDPLVHYRITARLFLEFQFMRSSLMKRVGELKTPTLVLQGGEDHVADPLGSERWVKMVPDGMAELVSTRGCTTRCWPRWDVRRSSLP
jgi:alpha-beta hydrolase superfamily lysophospholipase